MAHKKLSNSMPATYRIRVQGALPGKWSARLGGMKITMTTQTSDVPVTTLSGMIPDQAALCGLLNTLHDLRLPLLFIECESWHDPNQEMKHISQSNIAIRKGL